MTTEFAPNITTSRASDFRGDPLKTHEIKNIFFAPSTKLNAIKMYAENQGIYHDPTIALSIAFNGCTPLAEFNENESRSIRLEHITTALKARSNNVSRRYERANPYDRYPSKLRRVLNSSNFTRPFGLNGYIKQAHYIPYKSLPDHIVVAGISENVYVSSVVAIPSPILQEEHSKKINLHITNDITRYLNKSLSASFERSMDLSPSTLRFMYTYDLDSSIKTPVENLLKSSDLFYNLYVDALENLAIAPPIDLINYLHRIYDIATRSRIEGLRAFLADRDHSFVNNSGRWVVEHPVTQSTPITGWQDVFNRIKITQRPLYF